MGVHDQLGGQAAAYVLGALTPAEQQVFEAHLAACAACAIEVRELTPAADALARLVTPAGPAAAVRVRLLAFVRIPNPGTRD